MQILDTGKNTAFENMSLDFKLLESLQADGEAVLHFYDWTKPSLTYGYFIRPGKFLNLNKLQEYGLDSARRPTGGGVVFHIWDLAFSFLLPSKHNFFFTDSLDNYRFVNNIVKKALQNCSLQNFLQTEQSPQPTELFTLSPENVHQPAFCMARASKYDLLRQGKKIAGAAQRKKQNGYLHQGTLALVLPDEKLLFDLLLDKNLLQAILQQSFFFSENLKDLHQLRSILKKSLKREFLKALS